MQPLPEVPTTSRGDAQTLRQVLAREIGSSRWQVGDKLPTERELEQVYGVARNTIRRALTGLEEEKLIVRHVGRGTFKAAPRTEPTTVEGFLPVEDSLSPASVVECRLVFEPELTGLAVTRATQVDLDRMAACIEGGERATDVAGFEFWDGALHEAIAQATHNPTIIAMATALAAVRKRADWGQLKASSMTPEHRVQLHVQHATVVEGLRNRNREAARRHMRDHILYVRSYMFGE